MPLRISSLRWGVLLVGIGVVFLAINLGYIDSGFWLELLPLWPVLLIAIGIELIFRSSRLRYLGLISPLLIAATFVYAFAVYSDADETPWSKWLWWRAEQRMSSRHFAFDRDDQIKRLAVKIDYAAGDISIGSTPDQLFSADFEYVGKRPTCRLEKSGEEARVRVRAPGLGGLQFHGRPRRLAGEARLLVAENMPLDLEIDAAASSMDLNLSNLMVENLRLNSGASAIDLTLGCAIGQTKIDIDCAASHVWLHVPKGMGLRIMPDAVLTADNFEHAGLLPTKEGYQSKDFDSAICRAVVKLDAGVSGIDIDYY